MLNASSAAKTSYNLSISFSNPGLYSWYLGATLNVYDICDSSSFPSAPTIQPTS